MNRKNASAGSSVGRAPGVVEVPRIDQSEAFPVEVTEGVSKDDGIGVINREQSDENTGRYESSSLEKPGVGGSNPSQRTNLPATFTPDWLAEDMVSLARIYPGMRVLEPSAGRGAIVRAIHRLSAGRVTAIELNGDMIADLRDTNAHVLKHDFLKTSLERYFPRVVMNPPKDAVPHVIKAMGCLERGGRMVALVHADKAQALVRAFPAIRHYNLPAATFIKRDGFTQHACILVWTKP